MKFNSCLFSPQNIPNLFKLQNQPLTTDYGISRPQSIVPAHSYTGGCIRLVALITHMGSHRHKLPPTVAGHIDYTIGYGNGGHSILVLLTLWVVFIWRWPYHLQFTQRTVCCIVEVLNANVIIQGNIALFVEAIESKSTIKR